MDMLTQISHTVATTGFPFLLVSGSRVGGGGDRCFGKFWYPNKIYFLFTLFASMVGMVWAKSFIFHEGGWLGPTTKGGGGETDSKPAPGSLEHRKSTPET